MQSLKISVYKSGTGKKPAETENITAGTALKTARLGKIEHEIVLPLTNLHIGLRFLPKKIKESLEKEGIDISGSRDLTKEKGIKGVLIEIENADECIVISLQ